MNSWNRALEEELVYYRNKLMERNRTWQQIIKLVWELQVVMSIIKEARKKHEEKTETT